MSRRFMLLVTLFAAALTVLYTWPLASQLSTHVAGRSVDAEQFLWSYWWFRQTLFHRDLSPFWTNMLYFPDGTSLRYQTTNTFHALLSVPLQSILGLVPTFNLIGLAIFVASFWGMAWLAFDLSRSRVGAVIAGCAFAFAPMTVFHWRVGQYNMLSVEFVPVYIAALLRALRPDQPRRVRWVLVATVSLVCAALCDWQFIIYLGLFSLIAVAVALVQHRRVWRDLLVRSSAIAVVAFATLLPFTLPMLQELRSGNPYMVRRESDTVYHSADIAEFLVPNPASPLWGSWAEAQLNRINPPGIINTVVSFDYVLLVLAGIGLVLCWREGRFWAIVGAVFWVFALGPQLKLFGQVTTIRLPYLALFQLQIVQISRFPARFYLITLLCMAILAALGVAALLRRQPPRRQRATASIAILALLIELWPAPRYTETLSQPPSFYTDGTLASAGAVIEQPNVSNRGMYFQILHGRPIIWGELSRDNPTDDLVTAFRNGPPTGQRELFDSVANWNCVAVAAGVTHWVAYAAAGVPTPPPGAQLIRAEPRGSLYALPASAQATCLWLGTGWRAVRPLDDGTLYRWTDQTARLGLVRRTAGRIRVQMHLHCFAGPRTIRLLRNGSVLAEQQACGWPPKPISVDLDLPAGWTWLDITSLEPATNPSTLGYPDTEPIAVGISKLVVSER